LFGRVSIDLGRNPAAEALPTDARVRLSPEVDDPGLASLYFQYGRYLLMSSSRPGSQPANLQGLWNASLDPPWGSKYTININTQMNYWPAEVTNLAECAEPLFAMIRDLSETGARFAREHYGTPGWVTHHNTDLWRAAGPIDAAFYGMWPSGGAWLSLHLWERYRFSGDREFLVRAYPLMRGAAEFFLAALVEDTKRGYLVTSPSMSPENAHQPDLSIAIGPTMDSQIIRDLFDASIASAEILGQDAAFAARLKTARRRLPPIRSALKDSSRSGSRTGTLERLSRNIAMCRTSTAFIRAARSHSAALPTSRRRSRQLSRPAETSRRVGRSPGG
jgi:alpha-L-fucosidase 2